MLCDWYLDSEHQTAEENELFSIMGYAGESNWLDQNLWDFPGSIQN
jgi:hypothetical protein